MKSKKQNNSKKSKNRERKKRSLRLSLPNLKGKTWQNSKLLFVSHVILISLLAFLLSAVLTNVSATAAFTPVEKVADYSMSDMYNAVANRRAVRNLNNDILIVATDGCSRTDIAEIISQLNRFSPAAVGVDIFFPYETTEDSTLLSSLTDCNNLVLPLQIPDTINYSVSNFSFFDGIIDADYRFVNLELLDIRSTVRTYRPYQLVHGDTIVNFAVALAAHKNKKAVDLLQQRNLTKEIIYFPSVEFNIISGIDIINGMEFDSNLVKDKILILGDTRNAHDSYLTPLDKAMPGVMVHAYVAYTILSEKYITVSKNWMNWLIAIFICVAFIFAKLISKKSFKNVGHFFIRVLQFVIMYILFVIGCLVFTYNEIYIDFTPAILMIGLGAVAYDIWYGMYAGYLQIKQFIKNKRIHE